MNSDFPSLSIECEPLADPDLPRISSTAGFQNVSDTPQIEYRPELSDSDHRSLEKREALCVRNVNAFELVRSRV
jgi:hypothetical protein